MTPSPAAVTAQGVRDGERGALTALVERRGAAVLAYCDHLAAPDRALEAAGEAFAAFRRDVRTAEDPISLDPEALLRRATRRAAAARAPRPAAPSGLMRRRRAATCQFVPELLAARADGELSAADRLRLGRHIEHCEDCRAAEERFIAAEHAYVDAPSTPPEAGVAGGLLAALRAAAPNADERAAPQAAAKEAGAETNGASATGAPAEATPEPAGPPTLSWDPAEMLAAAEAAERRRDWGTLAARILVPALVAVAAAIVALIVGGAFSGGGAEDPTTSIQTQGVVPPATVRVLQRPATTPLPPSTSSSTPSSSSTTTPSVPPRAAQRVASDAGSGQAQPVRAVAPARPSTATTTVEAAGTGGTEAAPPTNGGAPASSEAGFKPSP